jgi:hypothetical protein
MENERVLEWHEKKEREGENGRWVWKGERLRFVEIYNGVKDAKFGDWVRERKKGIWLIEF